MALRINIARTRKLGDGLSCAKRPEIVRVIHPSVQSGVHRERALYVISRVGWAVSWASNSPAARKPVAASSTRCKMFYHVANIGDTRSLAIHPATTTHSQLDPHELEATGVTDGYVRLSVGIEHIDDIIADIERGLAGRGEGRESGVISDRFCRFCLVMPAPARGDGAWRGCGAIRASRPAIFSRPRLVHRWLRHARSERGQGVAR